MIISLKTPLKFNRTAPISMWFVQSDSNTQGYVYIPILSEEAIRPCCCCLYVCMHVCM